jgi:DNA-binding transcriptional LysR family regulator
VDRFGELEAFIAVVEAGSFVKAAQVLRSSTTAVSRLVQDLETRADLAAGRLVRLLPELKGEDIGIYAVYPTRQHVSGKVRALVEYLATAFAQPSWGPARG